MKIDYRPEIDGLRAIAVIAVILYHAQITIFNSQPFKGGFIGVDIFFVISGYLITYIILKEIITTGTFSFNYFYQRRVRRIIPALLGVMLLSFPFAWIYLLPSSFDDFSKSILYSLGFSSNFYFHYTGQQYGAISGLLKPFLHTWSLAVEEQFYILFPILLLITVKFLKDNLIYFFILFFCISLGLADFISKHYQSASFYFLHTRVWELLAGSIMAYYELKKGRRGQNRIFKLIFPSIGLFLILLNIIFFKLYFPHPSLHTVPAILGVCLIIWFANTNEITTKILSSKSFVGLGLISYSLYLWHYPIFAFARISEFIHGNLIFKFFLGVVILVASISSYYFIEQPARNKKYKFKHILSFILISISLLVLVNAKVISNKGFEKRFFISETYKLDSKDYIEQNRKFELNYNYDNYDHRKNVLIVGNSHAEDILEIFSKTNLTNEIYFNLTSPKVRKKKDYNFQLPYLYEFLIEKKGKNSKNFKIVFDHLKKQFEKADLIILTTQYEPRDIIILDKLLKLLIYENKKTIIFDNALEQKVKTVNELNRLDYFVFKNKKFPKKDELKNIEQKMYQDLENKKIVNNKIETIAKANQISLIKRSDIFCDTTEKRCPAITKNGHKIYWDYGHLTEKGSEFFAERFQKNKLLLKYFDQIIKN